MEPGSSIINISSVLGITTAGLPQAAYAASKAGLNGLTRDLAQQWTGRKGIRVNSIAPGFFASEMTDQYPPEYLEMMKFRILAGAPATRRAGGDRRLPGLAGVRLHHRADAAGRRRADDHVGVADGTQPAGKAPTGTKPGRSSNHLRATCSAGRPSISARRSPTVRRTVSVEPICRSAALGCSPARTPSAT